MEDEGVVHDQALALGLDDVEVVALGVGSRVADQEVVGRVLADVGEWQGERESVRVVFDAVHQAALSGVDFEDGLSVVAWWNGFDCVAFTTCGPLCLRECWLADDVAGFEEVAVGILRKRTTLDFRDERDRAIARQLAAGADVVLENFKVGGLARYGLDYASAARLNPGVIYASVTGFGQDGPEAPRAGYDLLIQASSGMMSITGRPDNEPGGGGMRVGVAITDVFTGIYASTAILAAVNARHTTGRGQHIDMALLDVGMAILANQASAFLNTGAAPQRQGNSHPSLAPYQDFPTRDGAMLLAGAIPSALLALVTQGVFELAERLTRRP